MCIRSSKLIMKTVCPLARFVRSGASEASVSHKLLELDELAVYWDTSTRACRDLPLPQLQVGAGTSRCPSCRCVPGPPAAPAAGGCRDFPLIVKVLC